jgi:hypothetical protein
VVTEFVAEVKKLGPNPIIIHKKWNKGSALIIPFRLRSSASPNRALPYLTRRWTRVIAADDHQQLEHYDDATDL